MKRTVTLEIKLAAGASKNRIDGWMGEVLKLRVTTAPERGKANAAACALIADALGLPTSAVRVVRGVTSPRKQLAIDGIEVGSLRDRLDGLPGADRRPLQ